MRLVGVLVYYSRCIIHRVLDAVQSTNTSPLAASLVSANGAEPEVLICFRIPVSNGELDFRLFSLAADLFIKSLKI